MGDPHSSRRKAALPPATSRPRGQRAQVAYTIAASPVGRLLVAATGRGICRIMIGDSVRALEAELRAAYPRSDVRRNDRGLRPWTRALVALLRGRQGGGELPLDLWATPFQCAVWLELCRIPLGETRSYAGIAAALGAPAAARAVARACASNPVPLLVPCHRVVRKSGDLGGYRWGVERKRRLLARERRAARTAPAPARGRRKSGSS